MEEKNDIKAINWCLLEPKTAKDLLNLNNIDEAKSIAWKIFPE